MYRNIDTLRTDIMEFASTASLTKTRKFVILDEADFLNSTSTQPALRNFMEEFSTVCGFIFICNYPQRIMKELRSRCLHIKFDINKEDFKEVGPQILHRIEKILSKEQIEYDKNVLAKLIVKYFPDIRTVLNIIQGYSSEGKIDIGILSSNKDNSEFIKLLDIIKTKNFSSMTEWVLNNTNIENTELVDWLFTNRQLFLPDMKSWPDLILILNEYQDKDTRVLIKSINNIAMLTEIIGKLV